MSMTYHTTVPMQISALPQYTRLSMVRQEQNVPVSRPQPAKSQMSTMRQTTQDDDTVLIAVMGATGSGKTTFINLLSGSNLRVGKTLHSCTTTVQLSQLFELNGRQVTLIDTPGFDDTTKSDADILNMIAAFLATTYEQGKKLAGVLYLHRISDIRMGGVSTRNFKMFRQLCGSDALKNVVLVTNMWGEIGAEVGEAREFELKTEDKFWKPVLDKGAQIYRHDNTLQSAQAIVRHLVDKRPVALRIQTELVDQHKNLTDTAAGAELNRELRVQIAKHQEELKNLEREMKEAINARDEETRKELEAERNKMQAEMSALHTNSQKLATEYGEQKAQLEAKLEESRRLAEENQRRQKEAIDGLQVQLRNTEANSAAERGSLQKRLDEAIRRYNSKSGGGIFGNIGRAIDNLFGF
ncbi:P-loop containing nucleoside triphosphate hydrolase protein [Dendrothele bispora CBS 962.96]|uniref:P-loop containing nucleoside triphosphate hydrolase protein n=1 Tax=Dendrothele bispora (strain CBS 962.96) TaxID=1314807 RepID=A0A4S8MEF8_DENBC|nr:P-loop containing nucleoside triphosphate hydrolase protein [Dendrothele bispora CBS 962.96]